MTRSITISLSLIATLGWSLMAGGLTLALAAAFGAHEQNGWVGICLCLVGKQLLNRNMVSRIEAEMEDCTVREIEAFNAGRRSLHEVQ